MAKYKIDDHIEIDFTDNDIDEPDIEFSVEDLILISEALENALLNCNESLSSNILADDFRNRLIKTRKDLINLKKRVNDELFEIGIEFCED